MDKFISIDDYDATIHHDILDSLTRSDDAIVGICEDRAVSEMRCYLASRYDCDAIFSQTGEDRHPLILMMALDIAVYHIFCVHNPQKLSQMRKDRYDRAVEWLKAVAAGKISINGAPMLDIDDRAAGTKFNISSNRKRREHF
jgi:phage gp36-like protein